MKHRNTRGRAIVSGLTEKATTPTHPGAMTPAQLVTRAAKAITWAAAIMTIETAILAALIIFS